MKNTFLTLLVLCIILLASCGSSNQDNPIGNLPAIEKLITQVTSQKWQQAHPNNYNPDKFIYENGKLVKAWFYACSQALYEFEYGANGKIAVMYNQLGVNYSDINTSIKDTGGVSKQIYDSQGNLISITNDLGVVLTSLDYDSKGRLYKINHGSATKIFSDFDSNDNPLKVGGVFTYDDKVNPIYVLFKKYGFFNVQMCNSLDDRRVLFVSPNNVKEIIYDNNRIIFSAIYSYDSDNYPISNSYNSTSGTNHSNVETYEY